MKKIRFRISYSAVMAKQGLPWSIQYTLGNGWEVHTASAIELSVPSWTEIDHTSRINGAYFIVCVGEIHWIGTKALITRSTDEKDDQENQDQKDHHQKGAA